MSRSVPTEIKPPQLPMAHRPMGLVSVDGRGLRIETDDGKALRDLRDDGAVLHAAHQHGYLLYSLLSEKQLRDYLGDRRVAVRSRHGRTLRYFVDPDRDDQGRPVVGQKTTQLVALHRDFTTDGPEGVWPWFDWCRRKGIAPASIGTMGYNLWKSTLPDRGESFWAPLKAGQRSLEALYGGRKEAHPEAISETLVDLVYLDLPAAYPTAMVERPFPTVLKRVPNPKGEWPEAGIARARVKLPRMAEWGPLPVKLQAETDDLPPLDCYPTTRETVTGCWTFTELALAREHGAKVTLLETWQGVRFRPLFDRWNDLRLEARELPGPAALIGKAAANLLWGQFVMNPRHLSRVFWFSGTGDAPQHYTEPAGGRPIGHVAHLGAETCARVRVRLARDVLYNLDPVYVDTDGAIVPASQAVPGWVAKKQIRELQVRASQVYRWTCHQCATELGGLPDRPGLRDERRLAHHGPHYSVAGVPEREAALFFDKVKPGDWVPARYGATVPAGRPLDEIRREADERLAAFKAAQVADR
jgi:hypothetical protein